MSASIHELAKKNIYLGTSSWKYEGWKGLIYKDEYRSEKAFKDNCLEEYARHFSCAGVDHTYYAWPNPSTFAKYVDQTPDHFKFGLKVTERTTIFQYPKLKRYGRQAGEKNSHFLDSELFLEKFVEPLRPVEDRLGVIMLEFSQFYPAMKIRGSEFTEKLSHFLKEVRKEVDWQFAVELRNASWLRPEYFAALKSQGAAHVFNSWTRMPTVGEQLSLAEEYSFAAYPSRILLNPGVAYAKAVEAFSPYDRIQEEHTQMRKDGALLIQRAIEQGVPAYVFVNNRAEGCAPLTIEGILKFL